MESCKEKGTSWVVFDKVLRVESGTAIAVNYLFDGGEINREILTAGEIVSDADYIFCLTDCSFSYVEGKYTISAEQKSRLNKLDVIREEKLVLTRLQSFFKYLIKEYSLCIEPLPWVPLPFVLTQSQIAAFSSSTRVTVTRAIQDLENNGFVKKDRRKIFVNVKAFNE